MENGNFHALIYIFLISVSVQNCKYSTIDMTSLRPIVMSGPSGGGKSTLLTRMMNEFPDCFAFSVSRKLQIFLDLNMK